MQSPYTDQPQPKNDDRVAFPQDWLLSFATPPLLIAVLGTKALHEMFLNFSSSSEEVFRGDRLPVLHFPQSDE
ncbi:conserved hypothetical protein [Planktothrix serta PCC 8927]|uniref:Uncharacterized protein n=2 Tax=Planktothrix TaxID=54304 RepID=A0A7Z9C489_9CYAN|nr:conserved hypothetical protein [Planktothrix serta PCC 8927]